LFRIDDHLVEDVLPRLERMTQDEEGFDLTDTDPQPERRALRGLYAAGLFTYDVFVTDARGVVLLTEPDLPQVVGTDLSTDPHVREALATGEPWVSGLLTAVATGQPLVSFDELAVALRNAELFAEHQPSETEEEL